jgi:hypothetical protein
LAAKGYKVNRYTVIQEYMRVRKKKVTPEMIKSSFVATGIHPINRNVFDDHDFAPSQTTSGRALVGSSYPDEIPSSDPAIPTDVEDSDYYDDYISGYGNMVLEISNDDSGSATSTDDTPWVTCSSSKSTILSLRDAL